MIRTRRLLFELVLSLAACHATLSSLEAHPVPRRAHDRTISVRLTANAVVVDYRLDVDDWTVVFIDLPAVSDQVDLAKLTKPREFYESFTRCYAPLLADNLTATLDGKPLTFRCVRHGHEVIDHLRCDFEFEAPWQLAADQPHRFTFQEGNYELEAGQIRVSFVSEPSITILDKTEPDEALKNRPAIDLKPGDDTRLRKVSARFQLAPPTDAHWAQPTEPIDATDSQTSTSSSSLLHLLLDTEQGFVFLLWLAAFFGAAHALTPGHGKALVAAYLVAERGTPWHALFLGLMTTLSHTWSVLVVGTLLAVFFPTADPGQVERVLGLVGGLLIAGVGFWLLLRRLGGQADHVHLPGQGHHHHGDEAHGHTQPLPEVKGQLGWGRLILLGIGSGIVPCWDAIAVLAFAISTHRLGLALPLLLAFSGGLACVLIALGMIVVWTKGIAQARLGDNRRWRKVFGALPVVSAAAVVVLGLWLCVASR
jgi:nickel/cobalt exporter